MKRLFIFMIVLLVGGCAQPSAKYTDSGGKDALAKGMEILADSSITDKTPALTQLEKACNAGNNYGCHKVGIAYNNGLYGKDKDYRVAKQWYLKAALRGYGPSQQNIANLYAYRLLPLDDIEGYKWLKLAEASASRCRPDSDEKESDAAKTQRRQLCKLAMQGQSKIRSIFRKRMEAKEILQAEKEAQAWRPQP